MYVLIYCYHLSTLVLGLFKMTSSYTNSTPAFEGLKESERAKSGNQTYPTDAIAKLNCDALSNRVYPIYPYILIRFTFICSVYSLSIIYKYVR